MYKIFHKGTNLDYWDLSRVLEASFRGFWVNIKRFGGEFERFWILEDISSGVVLKYPCILPICVQYISKQTGDLTAGQRPCPPSPASVTTGYRRASRRGKS